ncbi:hypothetical protein JOC94_000563 [Bacillus thermophilus]|uniref:Uncharacterized protein n=1 Tax=Siminovitchia thermophila TaxID=1245522 RepID=A0ABS2R1Z2_9BACI|nr:hypothetical protein [Siminovitchia thermophila]MBM7713594.1 hypothetical protein [Siminovitchia thermophila]ONK21937.1 hypothetical protein BLX87_18700 [Bacillus sp. VT-16-64]
MPQQINELQKISKALTSSYEILQKESVPDLATKSLQDAEQSFTKALHYVLSNNGCLRAK